MDNHIYFFRKLYRLSVKGQSSKAVWLKLIQKWAFGSIQNNIDHDSEEIHANWVCSTCKRIVYFDLKRPCLFFLSFFFADISSWTTLPLCGKAWGGRSVFPEILAELLPVHYTSFKIYMEIADEIEVNMLFRRFLPPTRCLLDITPEKDRVW